jgi:hypothetical protein
VENPYEEGNRWSGRQSDHTVFVPLLIIAVGIFFWFGFETVQLAIERSTLNGTYEEQERLVQNSTKLRKSQEVIAPGTQKLASQGTPHAALVVEELRKRDVTINPNASAGADR